MAPDDLDLTTYNISRRDPFSFPTPIVFKFLSTPLHPHFFFFVCLFVAFFLSFFFFLFFLSAVVFSLFLYCEKFVAVFVKKNNRKLELNL